MEEQLKELKKEIDELEKISTQQKAILRENNLLSGEDGKKILITSSSNNDYNKLISEYFILRNMINEKKDDFCNLYYDYENNQKK